MRLRLRSHQSFSSVEAMYSGLVSPIRLTCISNSVGTTGKRRGGKPQLGFPRLRFVPSRVMRLVMAS